MEKISVYLAGNIQKGQIAQIKGPEHIRAAMQHYIQEQYQNDFPMQNLAMHNQALQLKIAQHFVSGEIK